MNHKPSQLVSNQSASRARAAPECLIFATFPNNYDAYWLMKSHTDRELWIATVTISQTFIWDNQKSAVSHESGRHESGILPPVLPPLLPTYGAIIIIIKIDSKFNLALI